MSDPPGPALSPPPESMHCDHYFAYGSNLNVGDFDRFCAQMDLVSGGLTAVGVARLDGYRLAFSHYSERRGGGALNLHRCPNSSTHGALFKVDRRETWDALDLKEGHPVRYQKRSVAVTMAGQGQSLEAITYVVARPRADYFHPTDEYVRIVADGWQSFGLCTKPLYAAIRYAAIRYAAIR